MNSYEHAKSCFFVFELWCWVWKKMSSSDHTYWNDQLCKHYLLGKGWIQNFPWRKYRTILVLNKLTCHKRNSKTFSKEHKKLGKKTRSCVCLCLEKLNYDYSLTGWAYILDTIQEAFSWKYLCKFSLNLELKKNE